MKVKVTLKKKFTNEIEEKEITIPDHYKGMEKEIYIDNLFRQTHTVLKIK